MAYSSSSAVELSHIEDILSENGMNYERPMLQPRVRQEHANGASLTSDSTTGPSVSNTPRVSPSPSWDIEVEHVDDILTGQGIMYCSVLQPLILEEHENRSSPTNSSTTASGTPRTNTAPRRTSRLQSFTRLSRVVAPVPARSRSNNDTSSSFSTATTNTTASTSTFKLPPVLPSKPFSSKNNPHYLSRCSISQRSKKPSEQYHKDMLTVHQQQLELYKQNAAQHGGPWGQPGGNDSHALPMRLLLAREEEENIIAMMHPDAPPEAMGPVVQPPQTENNIFSNLCAESSGSGNRLLHDSQVQLHLLEQQNKKSVLVGKEEQDRLATIHLDELPSEASNPLSVRPSQSATSLSKPIEQSSDALSATPVLGTYPIDADDDPDGIYNVSDEEIERQTKRSNHRRRQQQLVDCLPQSPFIFSAPLSSGTSIPVQSHPALITNLAPTPQRSSHESSKKISASKLVHSSSSTGAQQKLTMVSQGTQTDCWLLRALLEPSGREPAAQQPLSYPSRYSTEGESQDGQEPHNQSLPYPEFTDLDSLLAAPASIETWQSTEDQTHLSQEDDEWPAYVPGWSSTFVDFDPTFRISNFAPSPYIQSQHRGADQDTQPHQDRPQQLQSDDYPYNHMYPSTPYYSPYLNCISEMNAEPWPILQSLPSPSPEDEFPCQQEDGTEANQEVQTHQGHPQQPQSDYYYPYIHTYCSSPYYAAFPNLHERGIDETNAAPSVPDSPLQPSRSQPAYSEDYDQSSDYEDDKEETAEADDEATESEQNENEHGKKRFPHKPSPLRLWNGRPRLGSTAPGSSCQAFAMHERLNGSVEEKEGKMFDIRKGMKGKEKANASAIEEKEKEKEELATIPQFVRTVDGDDCSIPVHPEVALFNLLDTDVEDHDLGRLWEAVEEFRSALELYEVTVDKLCRRQSLTVGEMYRIFGFTDVGLRPWRGTTEAENDATNMPTKVNRTVARNDGHGEGNSRAAVHSNALPTSSGYEDCAMEESSDESEDRDWVMVGR